MKYKVYELINDAYVFKTEYKDKDLDKAQSEFKTLEAGAIEKATDIGSEIIGLK